MKKKVKTIKMIDVDELKNLILSQGDKIRFFEPSVNVILQDIESAPVIEAIPLVGAYWINKTVWENNYGICHYQCSNCGYEVKYKPENEEGKGGNFCEECGALMKGIKESD